MQTADERIDRLYRLLPAIHRIRDHERGHPLHALLQVIAEQVNVIEDDIHRLYENWFIETCEDWVVPYIGDLIGYEPVSDAGQSERDRNIRRLPAGAIAGRPCGGAQPGPEHRRNVDRQSDRPGHRRRERRPHCADGIHRQ